MFPGPQPMVIFYARFVRQFIVWAGERACSRGAVYNGAWQARKSTSRPDRFEVSSGETLLTAELRSAIAVCVYDADEEAGPCCTCAASSGTPSPPT